MVTRKRKNQYN